MAVKVAQAVHQVQQRAEAAMAGAVMAEDMRAATAARTMHNPVVLALVIFLTIPALGLLVVEAVAEAFPPVAQLTQEPKAAAYRMGEKGGHKTERLPGLTAQLRAEVAAALAVLTATVETVGLAECISVSIFKGV